MNEAPVRRLAAVDIGTVTTRLLIGDVSASGVTVIERSTDITHLGERLTETGHLDHAAMARVASVIEGYAQEAKAQGVDAIGAVTTSAARDASNASELLALLGSRGIRPEVISGEREAALSFAGATIDTTDSDILVVDVGGGSTELVWGGSSRGRSVVERASSVDVGSRRVTEMFLASDPPSSSEIEAAREFVADAIGSEMSSAASKPTQMISVAGTATSLAAINMRMPVYDPEKIHGSTLGREDIGELLGMLASKPLREREAVVGLDPGRAPVIVAGTIILGTVLEHSGLSETTVSDRDILYGILLDTYAGVV